MLGLSVNVLCLDGRELACAERKRKIQNSPFVQKGRREKSYLGLCYKQHIREQKHVELFPLLGAAHAHIQETILNKLSVRHIQCLYQYNRIK